MNRLAFIFAATLIGTLPVEAETLYTCGQGTVRNVQSVMEIVTSPTFSSQTGDGEAPEDYIVTVQLDDVVYTGRSRADVPWNFDPTRLVVNQSISVCANNTQIVLDRADGTDYRARIVRVNARPGPETRRVIGGASARPALQSAVGASNRPDSRP